MMIDPPIDELKEKTENGYRLSVLVAKRAKELEHGKKPLVETEEDEKSISIAAKEIYQGKIIASDAKAKKKK